MSAQDSCCLMSNFAASSDDDRLASNATRRHSGRADDLPHDDAMESPRRPDAKAHTNGQRTVYVRNRTLQDGAKVLQLNKFPSNAVISSKYTILTFLPLNLFEQLHRIANFYFLCVAIMQVLTDSPVSPWTSILPLIFVLAVTAIKQAYEDYLCHRADRKVNQRPVTVLRNGEFKQLKALEIKVGDVVEVFGDEEFPCDLVLLSTKDGDGSCHVTTANLDGETTLKTYFAASNTVSLYDRDSLDSSEIVVHCDKPDPDIYHFRGRLKVASFQDGVDHGDEWPLDSKQLLLMGAKLKTTTSIYGLAVYTGQDTKVVLNQKVKHQKFSVVERQMNWFIVPFVFLLLLLSGLCTLLKEFWESEHADKHYLYLEDSIPLHSARTVAFDYFGFVSLFNYIIPISLYVTVELQKFIGSLFIGWDIAMYNEASDETAKANTSDLNEELGQVDYVFADKTGTLTENDMTLRQFSVGGVLYEQTDGKVYPINTAGAILWQQPKSAGVGSNSLNEFFTALALCHTVQVSNDGSGSYLATSPDEKAFVEAAARFGVVFHGHENTHMAIEVAGRRQMYKLFHVLEFDPARRRMSVLIKDPDGQPVLLCKGADVTLRELAIANDNGDAKRKCFQHVDEMAQCGYRTLVFAKRSLSEEEFDQLSSELLAAKLSNDEEHINRLYEQAERQLVILGATGVEDRLQEGVPETMQSLQEAGMKVWVLTGDKQETALSVCKLCEHFKPKMKLPVLVGLKTKEECLAHFQDLTRMGAGGESRRDGRVGTPRGFQSFSKEHVLAQQSLAQSPTDDVTVSYQQPGRERRQSQSEAYTGLGLVIDGVTLSVITDHAEVQDKFLKVCQNCQAVLCCRMSPLQKGKIVQMVKESQKPRPITLAVGDGANDVCMIQEAHVGIGIMGKEGRQAVHASDYAIARFCFLKRLLLVHGRLFYLRLALIVNYFFYKNVAFIGPLFIFIFFSAYSQQPLYASAYLVLFNTVFTSLPVLIYGLFEQDVSPKTLIAEPALYRDISKNRLLTAKEFIKWNVYGCWHSVVFFFGFWLLFQNSCLDGEGTTEGIWSFGTVIYLGAVIMVNLKLGFATHLWVWLTHFSIWGSILVCFAFVLLYGLAIDSVITPTNNLYFLAEHILSKASIWLAMLLIIVTASLPDILIPVLYNAWSPSATLLKQVEEKQLSVQRGDSVAHSDRQPLLPPSQNARPHYNGIPRSSEVDTLI